ncbi:MAG: acetoacetate--CoA ligase [Gammaproteobacteria bacterium]|nr:MAG: acetoacetate--CoA ligase [Gammaproteobacteria bacterium]
MNKILWQPTEEQIKNSISWDFIQKINKKFNLKIDDWDNLYQWSINNPVDFWQFFGQFSKIKFSTKTGEILQNQDDFINSIWFKDYKLNFAENLLLSQSTDEAIIFWAEDKIKTTLTHQNLYNQVACITQWLKKQGVKKGDVVAGFLPNMPQTIISMLATTSLGAIWSSCSPDFGVNGVCERFHQIKPKIFICVDGYYYNSKTHSCLQKNEQIIAKLPTLEKILQVNFIDKNSTKINNADIFSDIINNKNPPKLDFIQVEFNHPLYIMFSSGTTGIPKCIVHGTGGTLIQHKKEHLLHTNIKPSDRLFYYTTCGWMMWNWLVSALSSDAVLMLYDGAPFLKNNRTILFDYIQQEKINHFGTSAKYIDTLRKKDIDVSKTYNLSSLKTILSTGSALSVDGFDYVYQKIKKDVLLSSISGGTDIISCFALGSVMLNVLRGELQTRGLGMAVEIYNDDGKSVVDEKGELVCSSSFPSKPVGFFNDESNQKFKQAYFEKFDNIWCHGDFVSLTNYGTMIFYGRSDTLLNPGGVRIGTAEIYRQVEKLPEIIESIVVGQNYQNDIRVILFVKIKKDIPLDDDLKTKIRVQIRKNTTPRHVPAKIIQVDDIPRTKSGKITEQAVRCAVHNEPIKNKNALANPTALEQYYNMRALLE